MKRTIFYIGISQKDEASNICGSLTSTTCLDKISLLYSCSNEVSVDFMLKGDLTSKRITKAKAGQFRKIFFLLKH